MTRETTTEDAELERLQSLAISPEYKRRKSSLFAKHVAAMSKLLESEVRRRLAEEVQEIAQEWVEEGRAALGVLAEMPKDCEESPEFRSALAGIRADLAAHLTQDALEPSESEVQSHSAELAQCVLANWFSLLEHAKQDAGEPITLTRQALPASAKWSDLYAGTEAFALDQDTIAEKFSEYLATLTEGPVELAPNLVLLKPEGEMWLTGSVQEAHDLSRMVVAAAP